MSDAITRLNAALEGRYRIERQLGEGGMAAVYLADDLRHERRVALKVLKPELAAVVGADRFLAEIKTTAHLQHPHILPLFDSGEADGFLFYVMPYVEGESLRERLDREHQLPVGEAVQIARDVAEALQAAHEQGVIHRDVKPANILLSKGRPVISDFGIALALGVAGAGRLTETGLSLGTPHYMSPEQATGDLSVGAATDIYALGCVLYEMLVGEPPYTGSTPQAVLGKIVTGEAPSARAERRSVPVNVDAAIRKALEKVPADRFLGANVLAEALGDPGFRHRGASVAATHPGAWRWKAATLTLAVAVLGLTTALGWALLRPEPSRPVERFASPFGDGAQPIPFGRNAFSLLPDGSGLVYRAVNDSGVVQLWLRRFSDLQPRPVPGTEGGLSPSVSPDGERLAFSQAGAVRIVPLAGGSVVTLGQGSSPQWGPEGYVYAGSGARVVRWPVLGGAEEEIFRAPDTEEGPYAVSEVLPGGSLLLSRFGADGSEVRTLDATTGEVRTLVEGVQPRFMGPSHLVYVDPDGRVMAAGFDADELSLTSAPIPVIDLVAAISVSDEGSLFYSRSTLGSVALQPRQLIWIDRAGNASPVDPDWSFDRGDGNTTWSLSPDGTKLAVRALTEDGFDIWIKELDHGPLSLLTFDPRDNRQPRWAPDGERITFLSNRNGWGVWSKRADGAGSAELLWPEPGLNGQAFYTPDGEWLVLRTGGESNIEGGRDIRVVRIGVDSVSRPLLADSTYDEKAPAVSRDSNWIAYVSTETGREEVFVRPFPDVEAGKVQVSASGGRTPYWSHDGRVLFYANPETREMIAATFATEGGFRVLERETLFTIPEDVDISTTNLGYDVTLDDQRFVMSRLYQGSDALTAIEAKRFVLMRGFSEEVRERVPR